MSPKKRSKKVFEKQLALSKVNVNNIYNKNENYMPINFQPSNKYEESSNYSEKNLQKFKKMLEDDPKVDFDILRKASWQGIPTGKQKYYNHTNYP